MNKPNVRIRHFFITFFVIVFMAAFHYESIRYFYLERAFHKTFPKVKFLFPPAGWIMFYNVDDHYGYVEVYGARNKTLELIDPHDVLRTRTILFDNIHRNVLSLAGSAHMQKDFCRFLKRRFPYYDNFYVTSIFYPSLTKNPPQRWQNVLYQCGQ